MAATARVTLDADNSRLRRELREAQRDIKALTRTIDEQDRRFAKSSPRAMRRTENSFRQVRQEAHRTRREIMRTTSAVKGLGGAFGGMFGGLLTGTAAIYGVTRALRQGFTAAIEYERGLTKIQKTTKLTDDQMQSLSDRIKLIARQQGISRVELTEAATSVGRTGVTNPRQLADLTQLSAELSKATFVPADELSTGIARLHVQTNTSLDLARRTGDMLVHLGNNTPVFEGDVLDNAVRLANNIGRYGGGIDEVLASATAITQANAQAQGAATFWQRYFLGLKLVTDEGGPRFQRFADLMGTDIDTLQMKMQNEFIPTALEFAKVIQQYDEPSKVAILRDIPQIEDLRSQQSFFRQLPSFDRNLLIARGATGATQLETDIRLGTTAGQWDTVVQDVTAALQTMGDTIADDVVPALRGFLDAIIDNMSPESQHEMLRQIHGPSGVSPEMARAFTAQELGQSLRRGGAVGASLATDFNFAPGERGAILGRTRGGGIPSHEVAQEILEIVSLSPEIRAGFRSRGSEFYDTRDFALFSQRRDRLSQLIADTPEIEKGRVEALVEAAVANGLVVPPALVAGENAPDGSQRYNPFDYGAPASLTELKQIEADALRRIQEIVAPLLTSLPQLTGPAGNFQVARPYGYVRETAREIRRATEADRARKEAEELEAERARQHKLNLTLLRMEEEDERQVIRALRQGATTEEIAHLQDVLELRRDFYRAMNGLEGQEQRKELARIDRRNEELKREAEERAAEEGRRGDNARAAQKYADSITDKIGEALRGNTSVGEAMKDVMDEVARDLLKSEVVDPFKDAMRNLIYTALDALTAGQARGGVGGLFDFALSSVFGGFGGGGVGSAFPGIGTGVAGAAEGGVIRRGGLAMVGEFGPELMMMPQGAAIDPLPKGGAMRGNTYNFNIVSEDRVAMKRVIQQELPEIVATTEASILAQSHGNSRIARALGR